MAKKKPEPKPRGRPSKFTPAIAASICEQLATGRPLTHICRDSEEMPHDVTVWRWAEADPEFSQAIAQARARGYDAIAQECMDIADETARDTVTVGSGDHERDAANTEWISRSKLRVETRLKLLAKWDPKRYGEKLQTTHEVGESLAGLISASYAKP